MGRLCAKLATASPSIKFECNTTAKRLQNVLSSLIDFIIRCISFGCRVFFWFGDFGFIMCGHRQIETNGKQGTRKYVQNVNVFYGLLLLFKCAVNSHSMWS